MRGSFIFLVLSMLMYSSAGFAQGGDSYGAVPGGNGIFVFLNDKPVSPQHPSDGAAVIRIERKSSDTQWKTIETVIAPESEKDFTRSLTEAVKAFPFDLSALKNKSYEIWARYAAHYSLDSMGAYRLYLPVQMALGLVYYDQSAKSVQAYTYRVTLLSRDEKVVRTINYAHTSWPGEAGYPDMHFTGSQFQLGVLTLKATMPGDHVPIFMQVERQERANADWQPVKSSTAAIVNGDSIAINIDDPTVKALQVYRYRITPFDQYANSGNALITPPVGAYDYAMASPLVSDLSAQTSSEDQGIWLHWTLPDLALVKHIAIFRSDKYDGTFQQLVEVPANTTGYLDQSVKSNQQYYYYIVLHGPLGGDSPRSIRVSALYQSMEVPEAPKVLYYEGKPNAVYVLLSIPDPGDNSLVVFRNTGDGTAIMQHSGLIPVTDSVYQYVEDAANLEPGKFYAYTFQLVSNSGIHSDFADTIAVRLDKPIQLSPPEYLETSLNGIHVNLYWPEVSDQVHALGVHLWRKQAKDRDYMMLVDSMLPVDLGAYTDTTAMPGQDYEYAISSYGGNGTESGKQSSALVRIPEVPIAAPAGIKVYGNSEGAVVSWSPVAQKDIKSYTLYRFQRGNAPKVVGTVPANDECNWVDKQLKSKQLYFYYVVSESSDGRMSSRGPEASYYHR